MFPGNRKKVAKGKQFKYAKEEQTDTKIKSSSVWNSSLLSNVYSFSVSCTKRKYRIPQFKGQCFSQFFHCVISSKVSLIIFNTSAENCFNPWKPLQSLQRLDKVTEVDWMSPHALYTCCVCWGLNVSLQPLLWGLHAGVWSLYFVPCDTYISYRSGKPEVLKLLFVTADSSCWLLWTPLGPARVQKCSPVFFWLSVSSVINSNPSPENPSSLDTSNPCSQPAALWTHCKTHRHLFQHLWCPGL